ncbi:MAG: sialidase family protein [Candidatus Latescibacterota bacterium]
MKPICTIERRLYIPSPAPCMATTASMQYIGEGLTREEIRGNVSSSDWENMVRRRTSKDNGRNWSDWEEVYREAPEQGGFTQSGGPSEGGSGPYDPVSGMLIKNVFQRIIEGDPKEAMHVLWQGRRLFSDHGFYQLSADNGNTWGPGHLLKYEEGPDFDPEDWGNPAYYRSNEMYIGDNLVLSNGTVVISATIPVPYRDAEDERTPIAFPSNYREGCVAGACCFVGRWDPDQKDYSWEISNRLFLPRHISNRGLVELNLNELANGDLLLIMRGSNRLLDPIACPGRKWISRSRDGGMTWSPVTDLKYDTGESLYSPASICKTLRSNKTGKLYCFLNISDTPPEGNEPRYPVQVAEIDEDKGALIKDTVTVIDDRDPEEDSEHLSLSNFGVLEDRETHTVEFTMTHLGAKGAEPDIWTADTYQYLIDFI